MVNAARPKLFTEFLGRSQTEVSDGDAKAVVKAEDVFGLEVSVVNTEGVTILNAIEHLQEYVLDEVVVTKISTAVEDLREQVVVWSVVHDDVGVTVLFDDSMKGNDVGMGAGDLVESNLAYVDLSLAGCLVGIRMHKALDCVGFRGGDGHVLCSVNHAIPTHTEDFDELKSAIVDECPDGGVSYGSSGCDLGGHGN